MEEFQILANRQVAEHGAVRAWQRLRSLTDVPARIEVLKEGRKGGVYRLHNCSADAEAVIAKRCRTDKGTLERIAYQHVLPALDTRALQYFGSIEDREWIWLFIEDVGDVRYDPASVSHSAAAASWLGALHSSINRDRVPNAFPDRGLVHYARELQSVKRSARRVIVKFGRPESRIVAEISRSLDRIESAWSGLESICADAPTVFSHNDCLPKNVHFRSTGTTVGVAPFDWGGAGWAPLGADLGLLALPLTGPPETEPDYAVYNDAIGKRWPCVPVDSLRQLANAGQLFWGLKVVGRGLQEIEQLPHPPGYLLDKLSVYQQTLSRALRCMD